MATLFEFCIDGPPVSVQAKKRSIRAWQARVRAAASAALPVGTPLRTTHFAMRITYYYDGAALDVDNMLKPILDALIGVLFDDDARCVRVIGDKRDINGPFKVRNCSTAIAQAFSRGNEFLHIALIDPPDPQDLMS